MKNLLEVKDLNVFFHSKGQKFHAVRDINFSLREGEILGIVGESGCGKSALAKSILKLLPPTSQLLGTIQYKNHNLLSLNESEMNRLRGKEIGIIFQDAATAFNPTLKLETQMMEAYRKHFPSVSFNEVLCNLSEMLHKVGLNVDQVMRAYPYTLSGGMRQRVMIALTLACKPQMLIADEPTSSLDTNSRSNLLNLLKKQQSETGMSILLITHDMRLVTQCCDRVMVIYGGRIVEVAPTKQIFKNPNHPYTKALFRAIPDLNQTEPLMAIEGNPPPLNLPMDYCSFCTRCPHSMNICAAEIPPLFKVGESHLSACFKNDLRYSL